MHWRRNGNSFHCSCLESPRVGRAWWAAIYGVAQSRTWLKRFSSSRLVIDFLPRSKHLFISWLQSPSTVLLEPKKIKSVTVSIVSPFICHEVMGPYVMILASECWVLSQFFHFLSHFHQEAFSSSLSAMRVVASACLRLLIFLPATLIPVCASSSLAFRMMQSSYKLNKQSANIQP